MVFGPQSGGETDYKRCSGDAQERQRVAPAVPFPLYVSVALSKRLKNFMGHLGTFPVAKPSLPLRLHGDERGEGQVPVPKSPT